MKLYVGLITPNLTLRDYFGRRKDAVAPRDAITNGYYKGKKVIVASGAYVPEKNPSKEGLEAFLLAEAANCDACLLLIDEVWMHLASDIRNALLCVAFRSDGLKGNPQNHCQKLVAALLRTFGRIASRFSDALDCQLLCLPLRNFQANELSELAALCQDGCLEADFNNRFQELLACLRGRRRPRRRSTYRAVYIVDKAQRFFRYGHEMHARFETGGEHKRSCHVNGIFRFGNRIADNRHYNVSEGEGDETSISGTFIDCHNTRRPGKGTHLNMFPNDFF